MTKDEVSKIKPGLYEVFWKDDGDDIWNQYESRSSLAAVGITSNGNRWLAPVNWISTSVKQKDWDNVAKVVMITGSPPVRLANLE